jgi:hemin uptake protein HemP
MDRPRHDCQQQPNAEVDPSPSGSTVPRLDVVKLLQGQNEAVLLFNGNEYRLRITRQGKLLLTK